jgi:hypothetical protein
MYYFIVEARGKRKTCMELCDDTERRIEDGGGIQMRKEENKRAKAKAK